MTLHLVTGASRGLGLALVAALLRDGRRVVAAARSPCPDALSGLPGTLSWTRVDLSDLDAATAWAHAAAADRAPGEELVLLLNAGMVEPLVPTDRLEPAALDRHLRLNLASPMLAAGAVLATLRDDPAAHCRILAVSSGAARYGVPFWGAYCAAKAGLDNFVRALNAEADPAAGGTGRVRAVSLAPGVIDTAMQAAIRAVPAPKQERFLALHRDGGLATPDDAAAAILTYLRRADFGTHPIDDLREAARRDGA